MVHKLQKRQSSDLLTIAMPSQTSNEENTQQRCKSPSRQPRQTQKDKITRSNSSERKAKLIKKKSSKDKEQLIKGHVLEALSDNTVKSNTNTCECANKVTVTTNKAIKTKSNTVWKNSKLFDAIYDDDFSLARKLIIVEEADVNELCPEGNSVLHIASAAGYLDCLELLIECGGKINARDSNGRTPLEYAVLFGNFDCASLLIENGADANVIVNGIM